MTTSGQLFAEVIKGGHGRDVDAVLKQINVLTLTFREPDWFGRERAL